MQQDDDEIEMRGRRASPLRISKAFTKREEHLGNYWQRKRASEQVYLEHCEERRVLPLSSCIQSVIRVSRRMPCSLLIARSLIYPAPT